MVVSVTAPALAPKVAPAPKGRDRYLDTLRAVAIFRVVFYHGFAFAWLPWIPAMGVMFALAGSLMVRSIDKSAKQAVISRFRRLLPVVWAFGLIWIPLMIWHDGPPSNWAADGTPAKPLWQMVFWILPAGDPPGSQWGEISWGVLWYLKTYLWFVALSPVLLWAFRKKSWTPWLVFALPFLLMVVADHGLIPSSGWYGSTEYDTLTYMGCWLIGFAHGTGLLKRLPIWVLVGVGAAVAGIGIWYMSGPGNAEAIADGAKPWVIENNNFALGLYSFGIVFILMRFSSRMEWLKKQPIIDRIITIMNARAVTIYLWHNTALTLAMGLADRFAIYPWYFWFPVTWVLIGVAVLGFGWVEDFAARRKPELLPGGKKKTPELAAAAGGTVEPPPGGDGIPGQRSNIDDPTAANAWSNQDYPRQEPQYGRYEEPRYQDAYYREERHPDDQYRDDRYRDNQYRDDQYRDDRYRDDQYRAGQYGDDQYRSDRYRDGRDGQYRDDRFDGSRGGDPRYQDARGYDPRYSSQDDRRYSDDQPYSPQDEGNGRAQRYPSQEYGGRDQGYRSEPQSERFPAQQYGRAQPRSSEDQRPADQSTNGGRPGGTTYGSSSVPRPQTYDPQPDPDEFPDRGRQPAPY